MLNQNFARIARVQVYGSDQSLAAIARQAMEGTYFGIIPRDSTLFYPGDRIRSMITAAYPDIAAVSLFHDGPTQLSIRVSNRIPIARWCGAPPPNGFTASSTLADAANCGFFDASGVLYATTTSDEPINTFRVYGSDTSTAGASALGTTLPDARRFPAAFDFARQLGSFGSPVTIVVFRNGEADDYLASGTRVTYVLDDEQNAFAALASARANFDLTNGSVEYVDLRFDGKVYVKPKNATVP